jgi:F0F1-type ATP synthase assembly protein I
VSGTGDEGPSGDSDQEKSTIKDLPGVAAFATMGTTIASCLAVGVVLGLWADHVWRSAPWGLLLGIVLGTVAAVASVIKLVRRFL